MNLIDPLSLSVNTTASAPPARPVYPQRKLLQQSPEHPDDYILELDYSSASKIIDCARASENYLIHSREHDSDRSATDFGKLFHSCEELRLHHGFTPEVRQRQSEMIVEHFVMHPTRPGDHRTSQRMQQILKTYEERYATDGWPGKVVQFEGAPFIERAFKIELCTLELDTTLPYDRALIVAQSELNDPTRAGNVYIRNLHVFITGRIDVVLHDNGLNWVVDHKTSSRGGEEFESAFFLSLQTRGYVWAAQKLINQPVVGLIMNAVVILPPTQKVENNTKMDRPSYFYSADSLVEYEDNMRAIVSDFVAQLQRGYFPQYARSFKSPCAHCDYKMNCRLPRHQRPADLASAIFRDVTWNPVHE